MSFDIVETERAGKPAGASPIPSHRGGGPRCWRRPRDAWSWTARRRPDRVANHHAEALTGRGDQLVDRPATGSSRRIRPDRSPGPALETVCHDRDGRATPVEVHVGAIEGIECYLVVTLLDMTGARPAGGRFEGPQAGTGTLSSRSRASGPYPDPVDENEESMTSARRRRISVDRASGLVGPSRTAAADVHEDELHRVRRNTRTRT